MTAFHEGPWQLGGETAETELPDDYVGPCKVLTINDEHLCTLPNLAEAKAAARYASTPDGGYGSTLVEAASATDVITHSTWQEWALNW